MLILHKILHFYLLLLLMLILYSYIFIENRKQRENSKMFKVLKNLQTLW